MLSFEVHPKQSSRETLLSPKTCLNKLKMIQVTQMSSLTTMELHILETNERKISGKSSNIWKLNNLVPNNGQSRNQWEIRKYLS